ncbi:MAG: MFS transporter [Anaerolineales bacterium]|nr:MFS transporter [Anaerolineales bacterium]
MKARVVNISECIPPEKPKVVIASKLQPRALQKLRINPLASLLISTILAEVAGNIVYVILMERAFILGDNGLSVGIILVIQSATQTILGTWEGTLTDRLGFRKASAIGLISQAVLALGLGLTQSIWIVYIIATSTTIARGFIIPARLSLVTRISSRTDRLTSNTAVSVLTGLGLLLGPALASMLTIFSHNFTLPAVVAAILLILSLLPITSKSSGSSYTITPVRRKVWIEIRQVWNLVSKNKPVQQVLVCLLFSSIMFGTVVPLLTPLGRQHGLGAEGTGIFIAALGLGWTIGPVISGILVKRSNYTPALFITGLLTPIAIFTIGFLPSVHGIIVALVLTSIGGAGLNVLVITILQRLMPNENQGSIFGTMQTLSGLVWIVSPILITSLAAMLPMDFDLQNLFYIIGLTGALMVLYCWFLDRRPIPTNSHSEIELSV